LPASANQSAPDRNQILASLPRAEYAALLPELESVHVVHNQYLSGPNASISHVYFPRGAVISILAPMEDGQSVEGATIGTEGIAGLPVFLGDGSAQDEVICQVAGPGARMTAARFREAIHRSPALHTILHRYTLALMSQLIRTAGCNRAHPVDERCARWLLMTSDRSDERVSAHAGVPGGDAGGAPTIRAAAGGPDPVSPPHRDHQRS
jgi:CRP-like cAMP-binding protein